MRVGQVPPPLCPLNNTSVFACRCVSPPPTPPDSYIHTYCVVLLYIYNSPLAPHHPKRFGIFSITTSSGFLEFSTYIYTYYILLLLIIINIYIYLCFYITRHYFYGLLEFCYYFIFSPKYCFI